MKRSSSPARRRFLRLGAGLGLTAGAGFTCAPFPMDLMNGYLGDVALANGTPDAYLSVSASPWRLRLLNGSNARVFRIGFEDGRTFQVVGSDGGLVERPVAATFLDLGPGERVEIVADLSSDTVGGSVHLVSHAFTVPGGGFGPGLGPGMGGRVPQGSPMTLLRFDVDRAAEASPSSRPRCSRRSSVTTRPGSARVVTS